MQTRESSLHEQGRTSCTRLWNHEFFSIVDLKSFYSEILKSSLIRRTFLLPASNVVNRTIPNNTKVNWSGAHEHGLRRSYRSLKMDTCEI